MNTVLLIIDGMMPDEARLLPTLERADYRWTHSHTPAGMTPDSLCCILTMLGVKAAQVPTGRAWLEALATGEPAARGDLVLRCNGIDLAGGKLGPSCYRPLPPLGDTGRWIPLGGYKNLLVLPGLGHLECGICTFAPHQNQNRRVDLLLPTAGDPALQLFLRQLVARYGLWPWGQAAYAPLPTAAQLGLAPGAVVCRTEVVAGLGRALELSCLVPPGSTAEVDTDLSQKLRCALQAARTYPFVLIHINGADEAAHRRDRRQKTAFLQRIEREFLAPLAGALPPQSTLIVTADHGTDCRTGKHRAGAVPTFVFDPTEEVAKWHEQL